METSLVQLKFPCRQMLKRRALFPTVNSLERRFPLCMKVLRRGSKLEIYLMRERKGSQVNEMEKEPTAQLNMKCHFMDVRGEVHTNL